MLIADEIPQEVRRIIEFLNSQMDPAEVLAIEVKQFKGQNGLTTLVPRVLGITAVAEQKKARASGAKRDKPWDEASFFGQLAERGDQIEQKVARHLFEWAQKFMQDIDYGSGIKMASFMPIDRFANIWFCPYRVYTGYTAAYVEIPLRTGMQAPPFIESASKVDLVRRLNQIGGFTIAEEVNRFPGIDLKTLGEGDRIDRFLNVMKWAVDQVRLSQNRANS
jgi:hypothetical protein